MAVPLPGSRGVLQATRGLNHLDQMSVHNPIRDRVRLRSTVNSCSHVCTICRNVWTFAVKYTSSIGTDKL